MNSEKDSQIFGDKILPKIYSMAVLLRNRQHMHEDVESFSEEVYEHIPEEIVEMVQAFERKTAGNLSDGDEEERFRQGREISKNLLNRLGLDSLQVAEAVADPSLDRLDNLVEETKQIIGRYIGVNPIPVLEEQSFFPGVLYNPGGNLHGDSILDQRIRTVRHLLAKKDKERGGKLSFDDIMEIRKEVQRSSQNVETREFYEQKVSEVYAEYIVGLAQGITKENMKEGFGTLEDKLGKAAGKGVEPIKGLVSDDSFKELVLSEIKLTVYMLAETAFYCAVSPMTLELAMLLNKEGGVDVKMDGQSHHFSSLDYINLIANDLRIMKNVKDYLVNIAMEEGIENAVNQDTIRKAMAFSYKGDKEEYIRQLRMSSRVNHEVGLLSTVEEEHRSMMDKMMGGLYETKIRKIDEVIYQNAEKIFSDN